MAKSEKALADLKKLYDKQSALNKDILAAEKTYAAELKAEAKVVAKPAKAVAKKAPAKKAPAKKAVAKKAPAKKAAAKQASAKKAPAKKRVPAVKPL